MKITGIELLQKIKDNEIKEGFKIQCADDWEGIYKFDGFDFKPINNNIEIWDRYSINGFVITEFKILEENKEIEELKKALNKLNETFDKAYNKLIKESEEK